MGEALLKNGFSSLLKLLKRKFLFGKILVLKDRLFKHAFVSFWEIKAPPFHEIFQKFGFFVNFWFRFLKTSWQLIQVLHFLNIMSKNFFNISFALFFEFLNRFLLFLIIFPLVFPKMFMIGFKPIIHNSLELDLSFWH